MTDPHVPHIVYGSEAGIVYPMGAADRVGELAGMSGTEVAALSSDARKAANGSQKEIASLLRAVLISVGEDASDQGQTELAVDGVGRQEFVIGPELYLLGVFLISAYTAWKTKGIHSTEETTTIKEDKNGRMQIKISRKVVNVDPQDPLTRILTKILK